MFIVGVSKVERDRRAVAAVACAVCFLVATARLNDDPRRMNEASAAAAAATNV